jgi:hypothetical protein
MMLMLFVRSGSRKILDPAKLSETREKRLSKISKLYGCNTSRIPRGSEYSLSARGAMDVRTEVTDAESIFTATDRCSRVTDNTNW